MSIYRKTGKNQDVPAIISIKEVVGIVWTVCGTLFLNRESSVSQSGNHGAGIRELHKAHAELGIPTHFRAETFTGSNSVRFLYDSTNGYYPELRRAIQDALSRTSGTLYVFFPCLDRLLRPFRFDPNRYSETCTLLDTDYQLLWEWMVHHFGDRAKDTVFVLLNDTPESDRSYATQIGMRYKGNMGGKPPKIKNGRIGKKTSERLCSDAIHLAQTTTMTAVDIWNHFGSKGESVSYSAVKSWLRKNNLSRKRGKRARKDLPGTDDMEQKL